MKIEAMADGASGKRVWAGIGVMRTSYGRRTEGLGTTRVPFCAEAPCLELVGTADTRTFSKSFRKTDPGCEQTFACQA